MFYQTKIVKYLKPRLIIIGLALIALAICKPQGFIHDPVALPPETVAIEPAGTPADEDRYRILRLAMVSRIHTQPGMGDKNILRAMGIVPRHLFVPEPFTSLAYTDQVLQIDHQQFTPNPYQTAWLISLLRVKAGDKVMLIGTGFGYFPAVIAEMGAGEIFALDRDPEIVSRAAQLLGSLGYQNIHITPGDPDNGWLEYAPYNAILSLQASDRPLQSLTIQLAPGGRLVMPIMQPGDPQKIWQFIKQENGNLPGSEQGDFLGDDDFDEDLSGSFEVPGPY